MECNQLETDPEIYFVLEHISGYSLKKEKKKKFFGFFYYLFLSHQSEAQSIHPAFKSKTLPIFQNSACLSHNSS